MMEVFNPPRGPLPTIVRCPTSAETLFVKDVHVGDRILFVQNASKYYVNEPVRLFHKAEYGEDLVIESVNPSSNSITVSTPVTKEYPLTMTPLLVSNYRLEYFQRDFRNHVTEDDPGGQFWCHRFTYRIEAWVDSRIPPYTTQQTYEDVGDINFVNAALEDFDGNPLCNTEAKVP
jgi:hypothetical protein